MPHCLPLSSCHYLIPSSKDEDQTGSETALKTLFLQQAVVTELSQQALVESDLANLMQTAVHASVDVQAAQFAHVLELLPGQETGIVRAGVGWQENHTAMEINLGSQTTSLLCSADPIIIEDLQVDSRSESLTFLRSHSIISGIIVPIGPRRPQDHLPQVNPFSVLGIYTTQKCHFSQSDVHFLQTVANILALALERHRYLTHGSRDEERRLAVERAEQLEVQMGELERLNRLKDDFLSTISHELRTPMSNLRLAIHMLKTTTPLPQQERYLKILEAECAREISLIDDLLELQRVELKQRDLQVQTIPTACWFSSLVSSFQSRLLQRRHQLHLHIPSHLDPLLSDQAALDRILVELINNACKYTPDQGSLSISVSQTSTDPMFTEFRLANSGPGIPSEEFDRIFEKFYRIPRSDRWEQPGTGLGLALVKGLVEQLQGSIEVQSQDQLTTFILRVPSLKTDEVAEPALEQIEQLV